MAGLELVWVGELPNTAATFLWLLYEVVIKATAKPTSASLESVFHYRIEGRSFTFDKDESQFQPERSSENSVFAKVYAEPLIFSTDEDRTYDISSPIPKIRAFYPLSSFLAHKQKDKKKPVVKTRMPQVIKDRQTYEAYCPRYGKANCIQVSVRSKKKLERDRVSHSTRPRESSRCYPCFLPVARYASTIFPLQMTDQETPS